MDTIDYTDNPPAHDTAWQDQEGDVWSWNNGWTCDTYPGNHHGWGDIHRTLFPMTRVPLTT